MHADSGMDVENASLAALLPVVARAYNLPFERDKLIKKKLLSEKGINGKNLSAVAKQIGLHTHCYAKHLRADKLLLIPRPWLVLLQNDRYGLVGYFTENKIMINLEDGSWLNLDLESFYESWQGVAIGFSKRWTLKNLMYYYNIPWFSNVIFRYRRYFKEVVIVSVLLQFFGLLTPLFLQVIIDKVVGNNSLSTLDVLAIALVALYAFNSFMTGFRTYLLTHTTNKLDAILGTRIFRHLISLPLPYFEQRQVGLIMQFVNMLSNVRQFLTGTVITGTLDVCFSIVFFAVMYFYSKQLTLIVLMMVPGFLIINYLQTAKYRELYMASMQPVMKKTAFMVEAVTGMQTLKSLALEPRFIYKWEKLVADAVKKQFACKNFTIIIGNISQAIRVVGNIAVFWIGGRIVMQGDMTLGQLIAFQMLANQAMQPLMELASMWQTTQMASISMRSLGDIINSKTEPVLPAAKARHKILGNIMFKNVFFKYKPDYEPVIRNVSLTINAGQWIGIVGRSGSGKSTLAKLIQKLYLIESGAITIDDVDIQEVDYQWVRSQIGVVLQENYLFNGSVRDNIALNRPSADMREIIAAAKLADAHDFILELSEGYDTAIGERGVGLSGGQRQRLAIARALMCNPQIIIFDEATSALDNESEMQIIANLENIAKNRTLIMIAHRLSTVKKCDNIFVMEQGELIESGAHSELIANQQSMYLYLYKQQERLDGE